MKRKFDELDTNDLINLVNGSVPNYQIMNNQLISKNGWFSGSCGEWNWNSLDDLTKDELIQIYQLCKNSWKK